MVLNILNSDKYIIINFNVIDLNLDIYIMFTPNEERERLINKYGERIIREMEYQRLKFQNNLKYNDIRLEFVQNKEKEIYLKNKQKASIKNNKPKIAKTRREILQQYRFKNEEIKQILRKINNI